VNADTTPKVLVVGSANADLVMRAPRCPQPGESLVGRDFAIIPGGKGANQAVAAARLGATTTFLGCLGADSFGEMLRRALAGAGVDTSQVKVDPEAPTGTAMIVVADNGQNSIVVTPSANHCLTPDDIADREALFRAADVVLLQLEIPSETVEATLDMARRCEVLSVLDAGPARKVAGDVLLKADIVSPNETEAEAITGIAVPDLDHAMAAATRLQDMGAREVVLKLGAMGALYMGGESRHIPAFEVDPVDTTAAGDAFTAAMAVAWRRMHHFEAIRYGCAAGALAATVAGAQPSMPTAAAVDELLTAQPV
jgi:ribokinase